jgi:hypothetical protein
VAAAGAGVGIAGVGVGLGAVGVGATEQGTPELFALPPFTIGVVPNSTHTSIS